MKFYVEVYGCTANKSDADIIKGLIIHHPEHDLTQSLDEADILLILTCTVISTTEQRMLHRIRELYKTKKKLIIAGCMASVQQKMISKSFPNAILLPPRKIHLLFSIIQNEQIHSRLDEKAFVPKQFNNLMAPISIAEGCLFSCSYCITHLARGSLFSYPEDAIRSSVEHAIQQGCKEIQITAQDTASYGLDTNSSLPQLLKRIITIPKDFMIRVGMMNPRTAKNILSEMIPLYNNIHIYRFIHLPIQSGDNTILTKMNRGYDVHDAIHIIEQVRLAYPDISIATDAIIGFPTESDEQFQQTISLLQQINPDIVNITRFSARPFTKAKTMQGRIPTDIVKERSRKLTDICREITTKRNKGYLGKTMQAIVLKKGKQGSVLARSLNYKPVIIHQQIPLGNTISIEIIDATDIHLVGMLI
jgi:MiaB-like tRNA modifying enzyme